MTKEKLPSEIKEKLLYLEIRVRTCEDSEEQSKLFEELKNDIRIYEVIGYNMGEFKRECGKLKNYIGNPITLKDIDLLKDHNIIRR